MAEKQDVVVSGRVIGTLPYGSLARLNMVIDHGIDLF